jgi:hypothetical protein
MSSNAQRTLDSWTEEEMREKVMNMVKAQEN